MLPPQRYQGKHKSFFLNFVIECHPTTKSWLLYTVSTASIKWARFQNTSDLLREAGDRGGVVVWESRKCTNKLTEVET